MTVEDVASRLEVIRGHAALIGFEGSDRLFTCDPEAAHAAEDRLYVEVLRAIASGNCADPAAVAAAAVQAADLPFERWYA